MRPPIRAVRIMAELDRRVALVDGCAELASPDWDALPMRGDTMGRVVANMSHGAKESTVARFEYATEAEHACTWAPARVMPLLDYLRDVVNNHAEGCYACHHGHPCSHMADIGAALELEAEK